MIHITGDTHGDPLRFIDNNMPGEESWGKDDYLLICGDFGFVFTQSDQEQRFFGLSC